MATNIQAAPQIREHCHRKCVEHRGKQTSLYIEARLKQNGLSSQSSPKLLCRNQARATLMPVVVYYFSPRSLITASRRKGVDATARANSEMPSDATDFRSRRGYHYPIDREGTGVQQLDCIIAGGGQ